MYHALGLLAIAQSLNIEYSSAIPVLDNHMGYHHGYSTQMTQIEQINTDNSPYAVKDLTKSKL